MGINTDKVKIDEVLSRGVEEVIGEADLREKLCSGKKLRIKLGIDPTSPHLHIGRGIPLLKLRDFQELGHTIVFIIGDFTSVIGDTSDKESERPMLTHAQVEENKKTYLEQAGKIIDIDTAEIRHNSEWLGGLDYNQIGEHADQFSVADFIARDNIRRRLDAGKRVSLREVVYPLMQGYDSVAVAADVELGGTDQRFNMLAGRVLQEHAGQDPQSVITNPLVSGLDGRKMSSSWGNTINLFDTAADMYGKVMSLHDNQIVSYFMLCTRVPLSEVDDLAHELEGGAHPRDIKMKLAHAITALYHGDAEAENAEAVFVETFQEGGVPDDIPELSCESGETYAEALVRADIVASKNELNRLLRDGAVRNAETGEKLEILPEALESPLVLKLGKRRFARLI